MKYGTFALGGVLLCWNTGECPRVLCPCLYSHLWSFVFSHLPQTPPGADGSPHPTALSHCFGFSFPECFPPGCVHTSPHLSHTRGQNKERRWEVGGEGVVCLQNSAEQMKITQWVTHFNRIALQGCCYIHKVIKFEMPSFPIFATFASLLLKYIS